jgi:AcrR family transcriptional regulator
VDERARRIVETAVDLAEKDGFQAVRLRDIAAQADVALGTVYRRFKSKEDILLAALELEAEGLRERLLDRVLATENATTLERISSLFTHATKGLCRRPQLARALLRALASADPGLVVKVASFHSTITAMVVPCLRGTADDDSPPTPAEAELAFMLQQVWFATLVGWAAGLHEQEDIYFQMERAAALMLRGMEAT